MIFSILRLTVGVERVVIGAHVWQQSLLIFSDAHSDGSINSQLWYKSPYLQLSG